MMLIGLRKNIFRILTVLFTIILDHSACNCTLRSRILFVSSTSVYFIQTLLTDLSVEAALQLSALTGPSFILLGSKSAQQAFDRNPGSNLLPTSYQLSHWALIHTAGCQECPAGLRPQYKVHTPSHQLSALFWLLFRFMINMLCASLCEP